MLSLVLPINVTMSWEFQFINIPNTFPRLHPPTRRGVEDLENTVLPKSPDNSNHISRLSGIVDPGFWSGKHDNQPTEVKHERIEGSLIPVAFGCEMRIGVKMCLAQIYT